jgi:transcriptional regulator with XRE-family HTH domain
VDAVRLGLSFCALRRRAGLSQAALGERVGASASEISRIERGHAKDVTLALLERIAVELGASIVVRLLWQGEAIDRLLDAEHARLVEWSVGWLAASGWEAIPEVTFNVRGERGSIDVLARSPSGAVLLVEVKSVIPDIQALLAGIDRKARLARMSVAIEAGLPLPVHACSSYRPIERLAAASLRSRRPSAQHCRRVQPRCGDGSPAPSVRSPASSLCQT